MGTEISRLDIAIGRWECYSDSIGSGSMEEKLVNECTGMWLFRVQTLVTS